MSVEDHLKAAVQNLPLNHELKMTVLHLVAAINQMNEVQNMSAEVTLKIAQHLEAITPK